MLLRMVGGLCLFLLGMKMMSDGLQEGAGDRMKKTLNFMTGNRFAGVLTGFVITAIIQSSSAASVIIVSFVNAGLLTLTQSIGVIFGVNIGTTLTAWFVALLGFSVNISNWALPAVGIGFILRSIKWKYKSIGEILLGFGLLFIGLDFLTSQMQPVEDGLDFNMIANWANWGYMSILIGFAAGLVVTLLINSSSASIAIIITMAYNGFVSYEMAAGFVLGANIGTTADVALATIGARTAAKRAALVHILFSVIGTVWALPLIRPLLALVDLVTPGTVSGMVNDIAVTTHIAMLHTVFNVANTILFLPFVKQYTALVSFIVPDDGSSEQIKHYQLEYTSGAVTDAPELNILRAEKEIRDMAALVSSMYSRFSTVLRGMREPDGKHMEKTAALRVELQQKEEYIDEMRESLSSFLTECSRMRLNAQSEVLVTYLLRVIANLEEMSDECCSISHLLEKSVRKNSVFNGREMDDLIPYVGQVEEFLDLLEKQLGSPAPENTIRVVALENSIDKNRKKLQKLSRKRIKSGKDVKTELLFIDIVRRIEKLGDYCFEIAEDMPPGR